MSRASILIVVGVIAILAPFSGLPVAIRTLLAVVLGCVVIAIGVAERSREQRRLVALQGAAALPRSLSSAQDRLPDLGTSSFNTQSPPLTPVPEPQPEVAVRMDIPPTEESAPPAKPTAVRKPRARKAAPKTMSPI